MQSCWLTFMGASSVLIEIGGFRFLTDPSHPPDLDSPPLDFVLLSHPTGDHDLDASACLPKHVPVVTVPSTARVLLEHGVTAPIALANWTTHTFLRDPISLTIAALGCNSSTRTIEQRRPPAVASIIGITDGEYDRRLYVTGDTLLHEGLDEIAARLHDIDLCLVYLGAGRIAGMTFTRNDPHGAHALRIIQPAPAMLTRDAADTVSSSAIDAFRRRTDATKIPTTTVYLELGERYEI